MWPGPDRVRQNFLNGYQIQIVNYTRFGYYPEMHPDSQNKIRTREEIARILQEEQNRTKVTGYTSGVFDLMHTGHVDYLEKAGKECDLLIVGVNSDSSVRSNKGEGRPVCGENDRARVVAALACVDYVFIFSGKNNNENIETLKPSIYFKAADYDIKKLSSAPIVGSYGGQVRLIDFVKGYSTTSIINRIQGSGEQALTAGKPVTYEKRPAVFIDRDGTINEHVDYLHEPEKFRLIAGAGEALKTLREKGYRIVVVTNQPGIGLGYFTKEDFFRVNKEMFRQVSSAGASIDRVYFCPHSKADGCTCRKPATGMIERAGSDLNLDLKSSFVIGDMTSDVQLGKNAGCKTVLVKTGEGGKDRQFDSGPDIVAADLKEAASLIPAASGSPGKD